MSKCVKKVGGVWGDGIGVVGKFVIYFVLNDLRVWEYGRMSFNIEVNMKLKFSVRVEMMFGV